MALPGIIPGLDFMISISDPIIIIRIILAEMNITYQGMISKKRIRPYVEARMIISFLLKKHTSLTLKQIAELINKSDHSSVIHLINVCNNLIETKPDFKNKILKIENLLL